MLLPEEGKGAHQSLPCPGHWSSQGSPGRPTLPSLHTGLSALPVPFTELLGEQHLPLPSIKGISFNKACMEFSEVNAGKRSFWRHNGRSELEGP